MVEEESVAAYIEVVEVVDGPVTVQQVQFVCRDEKLRKR